MGDEKKAKPPVQVDGPVEGGGGQTVSKKKDEPIEIFGSERCCCDKLYVYLQQVECVTKTSTHGIDWTNDEIAITSVVHSDMGGPTGAKWPEGKNTDSFSAGRSTGDDMLFKLAEIRPDHRCRLNADVAITIWRVNVLYNIKDTLQALLGKAGILGAMSALPVGDAIKALIDALYDMAGKGEKVIDTIYLPFHHEFSCDSKAKELLGPGRAERAKEINDEVCDITFTAKGLETGEYKITVRLEKICESKAKKK